MPKESTVAELLADLLGETRHLRALSQAAMSIDGAADCLGVSANTVRRWLADGRIKPVPNTGRRTLIARIECERFAAGGRTLRVAS